MRRIIAALSLATPAFAQPAAPGFSVFTYAEGFSTGVNMSFAPDDTLYVGHEDNGGDTMVWRIGPGGAPIDLYGDTALPDPDVVAYDTLGIASGVPGSVLIGGACQTNPNLGCIWAVRPDQTTDTVIGPTDLFTNVNDITVDAQGRLLFIDGTTSRVYVSTAPGDVAILFTIGAVARGLATAPDGTIYVSASDGSIRQHAPDGTVINDAFAEIGEIAHLAVATGGDFGDSLIALGFTTGTLYEIDDAGQVSQVGSGFNLPRHITFGNDDALYITHRPVPNSGSTVIFRVHVCPPDINSDGQLNVLDFVAFQSAFIDALPAADCNHDDVLNILDFVCFQSIFQSGC